MQPSVVVCVIDPITNKGMNLYFNDFMLVICLMKMLIDFAVPSLPDTGNHADCSEERQKNQ